MLAILVLLPAAASAGLSETQYYAIFTDGKKVGYTIHVRQVAGGKVTTTESLVMTVTRMGQAMTVKQSETCIEDLQGRPLGFASIQDLGAMVATAKGTVTADGKVKVSRSLFGQQQVQTIDWPKGAMMVEAARLLGLKKGLAKGTTYSTQIFVPSMMQAVIGNTTVGDKREVDLLGRVVTLTEVTTLMQTPMGPISSTSYVNEKLLPLKTVMPVMGMTLEIIACDKAFALSENDVVDFLAKTLLASPTPLTGIKRARSATYHLKPVGGKKLTGMLVTDSQTVKPSTDGRVIVTIRPAKAPSGVRFPYKGADPVAAAALKPTTYLQSEDKKVVALARQAVGDEKDTARAIKKIEAFVGRYISEKNLSVGYASAAEVAVSRQGDCSEHAVLTAAMCRAVGIPARMVAGYLYVPKIGDHSNVFGGHAWAQAYVGRKWIGLDALHGGTGPGHLAQVIGNGEPADFLGMLATMGNFTIEKATLER